jgi:hypothetical protein
MVSSGNNQPGMRQSSRDSLERFDHKLQPFVGSPFSEGENAMLWISPPAEVGIFRPGGENAMRTEVHIVASIFLVQYLAVSGHQYGNRIGQKQHPCGHGASPPVRPRVPYSCILQVDRIHEVMQSYVRVAPAHPSHERCE